MRASFLIISYLFFSLLVKGQNVVTGITVTYDSSVVAELYNRVPVGLQFTYTNGQVRKTEGFLGGNYRWNKIKISTDNGAFQNGYLTIDRHQLAQQQHKVHLTVTIPDAPKPFEVTLPLPALTGIRFNHYADSLKRDIHFYLNVEGEFSSGKIYPLDTTMIFFESSAGKLLGQDLLLKRSTDTVTRAIAVKAIYKMDNSIIAKTVIYVKQLPDDESKILPDDRSLYNNRKNKRN